MKPVKAEWRKAGGRSCHAVFFRPGRYHWAYDVVNDSGCMHGILPHRRIQYIGMIHQALKPGRYFGLTCFRPGFGEIGGPVYHLSDWEVYEKGSMMGGMAFTEEKLKYRLSDRFECVEFRAMRESDGKAVFGVPFLWASLWRKAR